MFSDLQCVLLPRRSCLLLVASTRQQSETASVFKRKRRGGVGGGGGGALRAGLCPQAADGLRGIQSWSMVLND